MTIYEYHPEAETAEEAKFWLALNDPDFRRAALGSGEWIDTDILLQRWDAGELASGDAAAATPEHASV